MNVITGEPALEYVEANDVRFACLTQGAGPLVLFLHGFPDNAWSYRKQLEVFANAGYRAVAPFLRGYAPTEIPSDGQYDPITLGRDLEGLIRALSPDGTAFVAGMDWGGTSIFQVLATAPSAVRAAVVMNTAHPITFRSIRKDPAAVRAIFHFYFFLIDGADSAVNTPGLPFIDYLWKLWSPSFENEGHLASVKQTLSEPGTLTAALKFYRGLFDAGQQGILPMNSIAVPTLTIYGTNDPTSIYAEKEEDFFTGPYDRIMLSDVGHFPHLEREREVTDLMLGWFREHAEA